MKLRDENFNVFKFAFYDCFVVVFVDDSMLFMFKLLLFMRGSTIKRVDIERKKIKKIHTHTHKTEIKLKIGKR